MKTLILFVFMPFLSMAQTDSVKLVDFPYTSDHTVIVYEQVSAIPAQKNQLYKNAQSWIAKEFGDYKSVVQFEDKEAGRIICKGTLPISSILNQRLDITLTIDVKDQKYRCQITDIISKMENGTGGDFNHSLEDEIQRNLKRTDHHKQDGLKILNGYDAKLKALLASLDAAMKIKDDF